MKTATFKESIKVYNNKKDIWYIHNKYWRYDENIMAIDMLSPSAGQYVYVQPRILLTTFQDCISYIRKIKQICCYCKNIYTYWEINYPSQTRF